MKERILAVIPARGGSKGVPRKNVMSVAGKPLIVHTIETALACGDLFYRVIVSTDDPEIAGIAREAGADVPFMRPAELGSDETPMAPVVRHCVRFVEEQDGVAVSWVCLLQPTNPLTTAEDITGAVRLALSGECDSVISVVQVFADHPVLMKQIVDGRLVPFCVPEIEGTRRQDYRPAAFKRNGAVYLTRRDVIERGGSLWGSVSCPYIMPEERSVSIDTATDVMLVELLLNRRRLT